MESESETKIVPSLDYRKPDKITSVYRYRQVNLDSPVTGSVAGTFQLNFSTPRGSVINLARSFVTYTISATAVKTKKPVFDIGMLPWQSVRLVTERGVVLCDSQEVNVLSRARGLLMNKDELYKHAFAFPTNALNNTATATEPAGPLVRHVGSLSASDAWGTGYRSHAGAMTTFDTEDSAYRQYIVGGLDANNPTSATCEYRIPLKHIVGSIFNLDKDMYFSGETLRLEITHLPLNRVAFEAVTIDNANVSDIATGSVTVQPVLQLAIQSNQSIANSLISLVNTSGLSINYPYTWLQKRQSDASTQHEDIFKLNISRGKRLLRVLSCLSNSDILTGYFNTVNNANAKYSACRTAVNSVFSEDNDQPVTVWHEQLKDSLKNSIVSNLASFRRCGFVMKDYTSSENAEEWRDAQMGESGLSLLEPIDYTFRYIKVGEQLFSYIFAICSKEIKLTPSGVVEA